MHSPTVSPCLSAPSTENSHSNLCMGERVLGPLALLLDISRRFMVDGCSHSLHIPHPSSHNHIPFFQLGTKENRIFGRASLEPLLPNPLSSPPPFPFSFDEDTLHSTAQHSTAYPYKHTCSCFLGALREARDEVYDCFLRLVSLSLASVHCLSVLLVCRGYVIKQKWGREIKGL